MWNAWSGHKVPHFVVVTQSKHFGKFESKFAQFKFTLIRAITWKNERLVHGRERQQNENHLICYAINNANDKLLVKDKDVRAETMRNYAQKPTEVSSH